MLKVKIKRKGMKGYVVFVRCVCSCFRFFYNNKKNIVLTKKLLLLMQHFYRFYKFFGEEKRQGEERIVLSWSGFC